MIIFIKTLLSLKFEQRNLQKIRKKKIGKKNKSHVASRNYSLPVLSFVRKIADFAIYIVQLEAKYVYFCGQHTIFARLI